MLPRSAVLRVLLLLLTLAVGAVAVDRASRESNDFDGFHRAASLVVEQGRLSEEKSVERYLPSFSVLLAPLGWLPLEWAAGVWFLISLGAIAGLPRELQRLSGVPPAGQRAAFLVVLPFLVNDLGLGQSGPLLLWLATAGVARCVGGGADGGVGGGADGGVGGGVDGSVGAADSPARAPWSSALAGGALLALAAALKLLPAALLVVPLLLGAGRRRWASLAGFVLAGALVTGLCVALLGPGPAWDGLTRWRGEMTDQTPVRMVALDRSLRHGNQSLWIASWRTFGDTSGVRPRDWPRAASLPAETIWTAVGAGLAGLFALGLAAAVAARRRARAAGEERAAERVFALACLGMLFVSPLVWTHYFLWVLPALLAMRHRPRLVMWGGWAFVLGLASPALRSLGWHMACAVTLFVVLALDTLREGRAGRAAGGAAPSGDRPA